MKKQIDIEKWNRKEHYKFYSAFSQPFFSVQFHQNTYGLYELCKDRRIPLAAALLYMSMQAYNRCKAFRLRIEGGQLYEYMQIGIGSTFLRADNSFYFAYFDYTSHWNTFLQQYIELQKLHLHSRGLFTEKERTDICYHSIIPWLNFNSFQHAYDNSNPSSVPKIVFGQIQKNTEDAPIPIQVDLHHALGDGIDMAHFQKAFAVALRDFLIHIKNNV